MLLQVELTGYDEILHTPIYTETRQCDRCGKIRNFSYTCSYDIATVKQMAQRRCVLFGDLCPNCRDIMSQGYSQLRLPLFWES